MENKTSKKERVKAFLKDHWTVILEVAIVGTAAGVGVSVFHKYLAEEKAIAKAFLRDIEMPVNDVDEDIFTSLAPAIEKSVLNGGIEKMVLERSYDLGDNLHKLVTVNIENIYGD